VLRAGAVTGDLGAGFHRKSSFLVGEFPVSPP
jgi:hypothetical protein